MIPTVNGSHRITIGALIVVLTLVGTIVGGAWALDARYDSRYANKELVQKGFEDVLKVISNMNCKEIREELNDLALKEDTDAGMTRYDRARKNDLELRWQRECLDGSNS